VAELGREHDLVAATGQGAADDLLAAALVPVDVRGVEEGHAGIQGGVDHGPGGGLVDPAAEVVAAEADHGHLEVGAAEAARSHPRSLISTFRAMRPSGKKSLQQVLRERREATPLLSPVEASRREAARRREAIDSEAAAALARWRDGRSPDGRGKLPAEVYRRLFELSSATYYASGHWARRARAQLAHAPGCEVAACGSGVDVEAQHRTHAALGEEQPGRDLITLCDGCHRRARKLGQELGRVPTREELVALDPAAPLYDSSAIAALKAKYGS
jgi:hypothetical protein